MKRFAVIVAAGLGTRMGNSVPKQFLELLGKPVFMHSLETFLAAYADFSIILAVPASYVDTATRIIKEAGLSSCTKVIAGGASRTATVRASLEWVPDDAVVLVHDAARCAVTPRLVRDCCVQAGRLGSAIPVVAVIDSVRMVTGAASKPLDRNSLRLVQTPQAFQAKLLKDAYRNAPGMDFTDDATVVEHSGIAIHLIEGEMTNIKITRPLDLEIVSIIMRTG